MLISDFLDEFSDFDQAIEFSECPHCGFESLEELETYSHCVDCLHWEELTPDGHSESESEEDLVTDEEPRNAPLEVPLAS
jgi:Zn ribbon nucleic-acid-binding protein